MSDASVSLKLCSGCKCSKPPSEFYTNPARYDGLANYCRSCMKAQAKKRNATAEGKKYKQEHTKRYRATPAGKAAQRRDYIRNAKGTEKKKSRTAVSNAVFWHGTLPPAKTLKCVYCSKPAAHYHHHKGYSAEYRLDVIPLCIPCHIKADAK